MLSPVEIAALLQAHNCTLIEVGQNVIVKDASRHLSADLREAILRGLVGQESAVLATMERWQEKASMLEYADGYPRPEAEALAWAGLRLTWQLAAAAGQERAETPAA